MTSLFYEILYVFVMASGLISWLSVPLGLGKAGLWLLIIQLAAACLFGVFKNCGLTGKLISSGILSTYTIFIVILEVFNRFSDRFEGSVRFLWIPAIGAIAFIMGEMLAYFRVFEIIFASLSFLSLIPLTVIKVETGRIYIAAVFFLSLLTAASEIQRHWKKYGDTEIKKHLVYISPFLALIVAVVLLAPYSPTPYSWPVVRYFYRVVSEAVEDIRIKASIRKDEDYAESMMGFSEDAIMSGKISESDETVMLVKGIPEETARLRLAGKNFSTFTGHQWLDEDYSTQPDSMFDTIGLLASASEYTEDSGSLLRWEKLYIKYIQMNTGYIFAPPKSAVRKSNFPIQSFLVESRGSDILWPEMKSYKTDYNMTYLLINTESDEFVKFINEGTQPSKEAYRKALHQFGLSKDADYTYENFLKHADEIKEIYGQDVVLSDEMQNITDELLEGCESDYEKLCRIQDFLLTLEYTKDPGIIPKEVDNESEFLDYFILNKREGFCNYFATAFVLLARSEGIPARYVQGYCTSTDSAKAMYITSGMAHAWAEVYFKGAGWIAFDPTPGFEGGAYWLHQKRETKLPEMGVFDPNNPKTEKESVSDIPEIEEEESGSVLLKWYIVVIPVLSGIIIIVSVFVLYRIVSAIRFNRLSYDKRFVALSRQIFTIFAFLGVPIAEGETVSEYQIRLAKDYSDTRLAFMNDLERYLYDTHESSEEFKESVEKTLEIRKELLSELRQKNLIKYFRYYLKY
ncbi:MAG: transglutaminase-like domain-containing protein [Lachnospiraceae bacterium]|nr:transglutaminase-like domain-containing protein [Lachnospiraceae bacterium]